MAYTKKYALNLYRIVVWRGRIAALLGGGVALSSFVINGYITWVGDFVFLIGLLVGVIGVLDSFSVFNKSTYLRLSEIDRKLSFLAKPSKKPWE